MQRKVIPLIGLGGLAIGLASCGSIQQAIESESLSLAREFLTGGFDTGGFDRVQLPAGRNVEIRPIELSDEADTYFAVFAGGGAPSYNEIALEKNVLYFQRSLAELGLPVDSANLFFASEDDAEATVRYLDDQGEEQFKAPEIPNLDGGANLENFYSWFSAMAIGPVGDHRTNRKTLSRLLLLHRARHLRP